MRHKRITALLFSFAQDNTQLAIFLKRNLSNDEIKVLGSSLADNSVTISPMTVTLTM